MSPGDTAARRAAGAFHERWRRVRVARPALSAALPGSALTVVGLIAFAVLLDSVQERDDFTVLDEPVLSWLVRIRTPGLTSALLAITFASGPVVLPILVTVAAVVWGLRLRNWWRPGVLLGAMAFSGLLSLAVKTGTARPRPPASSQVIPGAETTHAFPSGHTIGMATLCLVGGYLVWSLRPTTGRLGWWAAVTVIATGAVGLSRLYLGYHFLTDVAGAFALAVAILGVVVAAHQVHRVRRRPPPGQPAPP
jgi:undecaprenyl-diphosphatase